MKNILLIAVCLVVVLGCDISKFTGKGTNDNANTAKPSPASSPTAEPTANQTPTKTTAEPSPAVSTLIPLLKKSEGKYSYQIKLFDNPEMSARLKKIMGADFAGLKAKWNTETPIEIEGGILTASGCEAHNCGENMYYLLVDLDKDNINVIHVENGKKVYAENGKIPVPKKIQDDIDMSSN